jgi:hypothetical protein
MAELLNYPILALLLILQMAIGRQLQFVGGSVDLVLLWLICWGLQTRGKNVWYGAVVASLLLGFASAVPWYASAISFLLAAGASRFFSKRFWHNPLIALFIVSFFCAAFENLITYGVLRINGVNLAWSTSLTHVIIPSIFLDLMLALPIYAIVHDMARWVYPTEVDQ